MGRLFDTPPFNPQENLPTTFGRPNMKHRIKIIKWWIFDREQYKRCVDSWIYLEQCRKRYEKAVKNHRARKSLFYDYLNARVDYEYAVRGE